ncbi:MAG TPA: hypothetical protein VH136_14670 [Trebonia sp.]|nr:hypothetical protein [Trebonia sp.]
MTIAALLVWMCTAAVGGYLLATRARSADAGPAAEPEPQPAPVAAAAETAGPAAPGAPAAAAQTRRAKDRFDPPSLVRAKSEPLPGMRALAEFAHPALAITGFAFWAAYLLTGDRVFGAIGFGILLGAICAGVSWFIANKRAVKRGRADALVLSPRLLLLHGAGAALTLLLTALITARV